MKSVEIEAPAKVNLCLEILAREESGYHGLETIFCALDLCDTVRVEMAGDGIELRVDGQIYTGPADENLAVRAARFFYQELGEPAAVRLTLTKRIPSAAGLGGGSSDAAATLLALNAAHGEPFTQNTLLQWGSALGSDVPFFLCGSPCALAWSRGERLLALPTLPERPVLVAHPGEPIATGAAFAEIARRRGGGYTPRAAAYSLADFSDWRHLERLARNDFELPATDAVPRLAKGLRLMREAGAAISLLAGSGASIFGVFDSVDDITAAAETLEAAGFTCWRTATRVNCPHPQLSIPTA